MSFMQPRVWKAYYYEVETNCGTTFVDASWVGSDPTPDDFRDFVEGKIDENTTISEKQLGYLCQMSAPGYMDQTDISAFETEKEAWQHLLEFYGTNDGEPEDWEDEAEEYVCLLDGKPQRTWLKVEPPSRQYKPEDVLFIDVTDLPPGSLAWDDYLGEESINCEEVENGRIANAVMSHYGETEEQAGEALHSEVARELCQMLNFVLHKTGKEVSTDSSFSLVKSRRELTQGRGT